MISIIRAIRHRRYFRRRFAGLHQRVRERLFAPGERPRVATGPFMGMNYLDEIVWGSITSKWLGSYEAELHGVIETIVATDYRTVLDVGCAEGYYAVGLAMKLRDARVEAFDLDFISRWQTRRLARLNAVKNLHVHSRCAARELEAPRAGRTLMVCDIEGGEGGLLDPRKSPALREWDLLAEVHERVGAPEAVMTQLVDRFGSTHRIEIIVSTEREAWIQNYRAQFPEVSDQLLREATDEHRAMGQVWLWMQRG